MDKIRKGDFFLIKYRLDLSLCNLTCALNNIPLLQDFKLKSGQFDISLIPDIYDCIKYDVQHNRFENFVRSFERNRYWL